MTRRKTVHVYLDEAVVDTVDAALAWQGKQIDSPGSEVSSRSAFINGVLRQELERREETNNLLAAADESCEALDAAEAEGDQDASCAALDIFNDAVSRYRPKAKGQEKNPQD
ncbi:MAG TPA: hypothetical protein VM243_10250 [Phycisphaerae bacterium]|nr:hypothetical protein [Phycisphaerae bacterium]